MTDTTKTPTLRDICKQAGLDPFEYDGYRNTTREVVAEREMAGQTHYFDADTRRFFGSRVLELHAYDAIMFTVIESAKGDPDGRSRVFRPVVFGVDGFVIHRPDMDDSYASAAAARKALSAFVAKMDTRRELYRAIDRKLAQHRREAHALEAAQVALGCIINAEQVAA